MDAQPRVDPDRVAELLRQRSCPWPAPHYADSTESTNADAAAAVAHGAASGTCFVAGEQTAGRGRHGRTWISDPGAGLWSSTIVRDIPTPSRVPLMAALAVLDTARELAGLELGIKWPNDVLNGDGRKMAGILVEVEGDAVIIGIGINVDYEPRQLPHEHATSWFIESGAHPERSELLAVLLTHLRARLSQDWDRALVDYRAVCRTIGAVVRVVLPGGEEFTGTAIDVDQSGHLLVDAEDGGRKSVRTVVAGDVIHATIAT